MPRKRRDGQIEPNASIFLQFTGKCGHLEKQVCCYDALAWILESNPDLGGGMNGWLKRLSLVALCQCQLGSEVEIVGERICCRCFQVLMEEEVAPSHMRNQHPGKVMSKHLNTAGERDCYSSLKQLTGP